MKNALIIAAAILIVGIIAIFVFAPKPTPEQIQAKAAADAAAAMQQAALEQQRSEERIKELQATPASVQAANKIGDTVTGAVGAYIGWQVLKTVLGN